MLTLAELVLPAVLAAPAPGAGKDRYWLFEPTPRAMTREMSTDRPDTTESPFTLDAGHVQLELSLVDFTYNRRNNTGGTVRAIAVAPLLVKVGLTNSLDLQVGLDPWTQQRTEDRAAGTADTVGGFGDTTVRLKVNLFGNDSTEKTGGWALAVMPFATVPTARDGLGADKIEGGLIVPAAIDLCQGWSLGLMMELDVIRSGAGDRYVYDLVHTATLAHDLTDDTGCYIEYAGFLSLNNEDDYRAYLDAGFTRALGGDVQLDLGVRVGLTEITDDFGVFTGISLRF
jgi:hypothetical protein